MDGVSRVARFAPADAADAGAALLKDGAVVLDRLFDPEVVDNLRASVMARHPELASKHLLSDYLDTGPGRFVAPVVIDAAVIDSGILTSPTIAEVVATVLGEDWVVEAFGLVMSEAGAPEQGHHRDGKPLFPDSPVGKFLPPYALTIMIPLVDVGAHNGSTAILVGSHGSKAHLASDVPDAPEVPRGSAIAWTFRTWHWGLPNTTDTARPVLYLTVCRPFWLDDGNFGRKARTRLALDAAASERLDRRFRRATIVDA